MAGFERTNVSDSGGGEVQQTADADAAQRHYQAGVAALDKNDLAGAEEEMQAAARLAPKNALIFYKLAVIQSKRDEWQPALKNIDAARKLGLPKDLEDEAHRRWNRAKGTLATRSAARRRCTSSKRVRAVSR